MHGDRRRSFHDIVTWAVAERILPAESAWLELRSLRNRPTHEYDLAGADVPELLAFIRQGTLTLNSAIQRFARLCEEPRLLGDP